jgi:uncharacterized coiled-coil protein SlyX
VTLGRDPAPPQEAAAALEEFEAELPQDETIGDKLQAELDKLRQTAQDAAKDRLAAVQPSPPPPLPLLFARACFTSDSSACLPPPLTPRAISLLRAGDQDP